MTCCLIIYCCPTVKTRTVLAQDETVGNFKSADLHTQPPVTRSHCYKLKCTEMLSDYIKIVRIYMWRYQKNLYKT